MNISNSRMSTSIPAQSVNAASGAASAKAMSGRDVSHMKAPTPAPQGSAADETKRGGEVTDRTSGLARLDGVAQAIMDRVRSAALDGPEGQEGSFREAAAFIEHGLERLRNGYADGTLSPKDIDRGFGNLFQGATEIMSAGRDSGDSSAAMNTGAVAAAAPASVSTAAQQPAPADGEGDSAESGDTDMAAAVRERLSSFVDHATERALGADYPDEERQAVAEAATAIFNQAAERLENAVFNPGNGDPIDRDGLASLFQATFTALQGQIQSLLGDQSQSDRGAPAAIYGPGAGAEAINSPAGRFNYAG